MLNTINQTSMALIYIKLIFWLAEEQKLSLTLSYILFVADTKLILEYLSFPDIQGNGNLNKKNQDIYFL